ncbi:MAG: M56 family metallopeptidase [Planctomycetaceae bacterium]
MNGLLTWPDPAHVDQLARVLLHSLWQGLAIAGLLAITLRLLPSERTSLRFKLSLAALYSVILAACLTWSVLNQADPPGPSTLAFETTSMPVAVTLPASLRPLHNATADPNTGQSTSRPPAEPTTFFDRKASSVNSQPSERTIVWSNWCVLGWLIGAASMLVRGLRDLLAARRLTTGAECADPAVRNALARVLSRIPLRRNVRPVLTTALDSPAVWGLWRPVLLWPASLVGSVTADEAAAIVAHELAHILRYDQWTMMLQLVIESLLFFNPAVWWISRQVRQEREACCDAFAAEVVGDRIEYARVLATYAERVQSAHSIAPSRQPVGAPAFADGSNGSLLDRVRRLLLPGYRPSLRLSWSHCLTLLMLTCVALWGVHKTADLSVAVAQEILSDRQRVEQLTERAEQVAPQMVEQPKFDKVRITGRIEIDPSLKTVKGVHVSAQVTDRLNGSSLMKSMGYLTTNTFDLTVEAGRLIVLMFEHPDAASSYLGPYGPQDGPLIENQLVRIVPGEPRTIRVVDGDGVPAAKVRVGFSGGIDGLSFSGISRAVETDAQGVVVVPHLKPGNLYRLSFSGAGYQRKDSQNFAPFGSGPDVFQVLRARPASGVVTNEAGLPVEGVSVRDFKSLSPGFVRDGDIFAPPLAVTDSAGRFVLTTLQDGSEYVLLLEHKDYARATISHVKAGDQNVSGTVTPGVTVRGRVERSGAHMPYPKSIGWYEWIAYQGLDGRSETDNTRSESTAVDAEGRFTLPHINPGEIEVSSGNRRQTFSVSPASTEIVFALTPAKPPEVARRTMRVRFAHDGQTVQPTGKLRLNGRFPPNLPAGELPAFQPVVIQNGVATFNLPVPAKSLGANSEGLIGFWFNSHDVNLPDLEPSSEPAELTIEVVPAGAVSGRIINSDGTPATNAGAGVSVNFSYRSPSGSHVSHGGGVSANTDAEGRYFLSPIPIGAECTLSGTQGQYRQSEGPISITAATPLVTRDIHFGTAEDVAGVVVDANGSPLVGIPLELNFDLPGSSQRWLPPVTSTAEGRFQFERLNPRGRYFVDIALRKQWQPLRAELTFSESNRFVLQPGEVVEGTVLDEAGNPVPGVEVYAASPDYATKHNGRVRFESEGRTDAAGRFRFSTLPAAQLRFDSSELRDEEQVVDTAKTHELTLQGELMDWYRRKLNR